MCREYRTDSTVFYWMTSSLFSLYSICTNLGKPFAIIANATCAAHMKTKFCRSPPPLLICAPRVGASLPFRRAGVCSEIRLMCAAGPTEGKVFICQRVRFLWPVYAIVRANYLHMPFYGISKKPCEDTGWCFKLGKICIGIYLQGQRRQRIKLNFLSALRAKNQF